MTLYAIWVSDVSGVRAVHGFRIAMWATVLFALLTAAYQYNQLFGFGGEALAGVLQQLHSLWVPHDLAGGSGIVLCHWRYQL